MRISWLITCTLAGALLGLFFTPSVRPPATDELDSPNGPLGPLWYAIIGTLVGLVIDITRGPMPKPIAHAITAFRRKHPPPADGSFLAELERSAREPKPTAGNPSD